MNKIIGIVLVLLSITLSGVSGYLFFKAEKTSEDNHVLNNIENIYALQKIDAAWSLATLKTLSVVESDFDQVAAFLPKFHELRNKLSNSELASSQSPAPLKNKLLAFLSMLGGKEHAIEQFKSNLAVVRNSKKYLPLASDLLAEKIKRITDKDLASRIVLINDQVNAYLAAPNADERIKLLEELAELDKSLMGFPQDLVNPLSNYIAHAKVLTERKEPMDRIVTRVTDDSVAKAGIELIVLYKGYVEKRSIVLEDERTLNNIFVLLVAILLSIIAIISGVYVISSANKI